jgi:hypothetical protein
MVAVVVLMTSDLPFSNYIPGKEYFFKNLVPTFTSLFSGLKPLFTNVKTFMIPVTVIIAGSLLVGFDYFLFRKSGVSHQTTH